MQTLGLSESTPRSEGRIKSLLWPAIHSGVDVDYLGVQGYWICTLVALISLLAMTAQGQSSLGIANFLLYYFGGIGVREGSRYAAGSVFALYLLDTIFVGLGVVRVIFGAVLLSNFRATWIAPRWKAGSPEVAAPLRLSETWGDKFADKLPYWLWPKIRIPYYILSVCVVVLAAVGIAMLISHDLAKPR
jgi:hypothetical protein